MSGLEAIGAIASVSQLVQYTTTLVLKLHELYRNVENAGEQYRRYKDEIHQLLQIAGLVKSVDELLQSEIVASHIHALVKATESIEEALRQGYVGDITKRWKKCLKAWQWNKAEEAIAKGFADLERNKSCLTLCILGTYGSLISRIDRNLEDGIPQLQGQVGNIEYTLRSCTGLVEEGGKIRSNPSSFCKVSCSNRKCKKMHKRNGDSNELVILGARAIQEKSKIAQNDSCPGTPNTDKYPEILAESGVLVPHPKYNNAESDSGYDTFSECTLANGPSPPKRSWSDNMASDKAMQINGCVGRRADLEENPFTRCQWSQNHARDESNQVNGEVLDADFAALFFSRRTTVP